MPPAFALSQDQTLKFIRSNASIPATPLRIARPSASELRHHSLQYLSQGTEVAPSSRYSLTSSPGRAPFPGPPAGSPAPTSPCSSARTPATHPSPQVHPARQPLGPPQHTPWFKHAPDAQLHPTPVSSRSPHVPPRSPSTIRQITQAKQPGQSTVKPLFICQGAKPKPVGRTSALRKTPSPGASLPVNIQPVGRKPAAEATLSASPPVNGLIRAADWAVKPRGADSFQISCTPPVAPHQPLLARRLRRRWRRSTVPRASMITSKDMPVVSVPRA